MREKWLLCLMCLGVLSTVNGQDICDQSYMGRMRTGIISSDNYPFNYRLQRHCRHRIFLDDGNSRPNQTVCFTFSRFQVEYSSECRQAYLEFPSFGNSIKYCGEGVWHREPSEDRYSNIFTENLCWLVEYRWSTAYMDINFVGNYMGYKGYYGQFEIHDVFSTIPKDAYLVTRNSIIPASDLAENDLLPLNSQTEMKKKEAAISTPPCATDDYTCFCRECIPEGGLCNGVPDCTDGSDEDFVHARCPNAQQSLEGCNFENGNCQFSLRNMIVTKQSTGGPRYDHTYDSLRDQGNGGHFIQPTYTTELTADITYTLVPISGSKHRCLSFWYFMSGVVGTLNVIIRNTGTAGNEVDSTASKPPSWFRDNNHGNAWRQGEIDLPQSAFPLLEVRFHTIKGEDPYSHIGLDDISTSDGKCSGYDPSCAFELGFCGWALVLPDAGGALWTRRRGLGASRHHHTGPQGDARTGDGYYLYMQSSLYPAGATGAVLSRSITFNFDKDNLYCLQVAYHMYGSGVAQIAIWLHHHDNSKSLLETLSGNHGDEWHKLQLAVTPSDVSGPFQVAIEGTVGNNVSGDLAIDDIIITQGTCLSDKPTPTSTPLPSTAPPLECPPGYWLCHSGDECIPKDRVCDGRLDCADLSDEKDCSPGGQSIGLWIALGLTTVILLVIVIAALLYKVKYKHYDDRPDTPVPPHFPPNFLLDTSSPQVFDEDYEEIQDVVFPDNIAFDGSTFRADPPPPYAHGPALPSYTQADSPPPLYSPDTRRHQTSNHDTNPTTANATNPSDVVSSSTVTVSVTYPHEPPPSYEIAIVARPQLDAEGQTSATPTHDHTAESIQSQPQISVRIASRSASRDGLNASFDNQSRNNGIREESRYRQNSEDSTTRQRDNVAQNRRGPTDSYPQPGPTTSGNYAETQQSRKRKNRKSQHSELLRQTYREGHTNSTFDNSEHLPARPRREVISICQPDIIGQGALGLSSWIPQENNRQSQQGDYTAVSRPGSHYQTASSMQEHPHDGDSTV